METVVLKIKLIIENQTWPEEQEKKKHRHWNMYVKKGSTEENNTDIKN